MTATDGRASTASRSEERALVERARSGDRQAFGLLYQRHVDRIFSYVGFRVRDEALAEDLTQDVFVQALHALPGFDWRGSMAPWLLRIARNTVTDHWRRKARRPERPLAALALDEREEERVATEWLASAGAEEAAANAETALDWRRVMSATEALTELQRQVLALRFAAGLSVRETAEAMDRSEGAVKNLQHHALKALKRRIDEDEQ